MKDTYVQAVLAQLERGQEPHEVIAGLMRTLAVRGHSRLTRSILTATLTALTTRAKTQRPKITVASHKALEHHAEAIQTALKKLEATDEPSITVDETIVGGFVVEHNHTRLDNSYKSKLVTLYRSITK